MHFRISQFDKKWLVDIADVPHKKDGHNYWIAIQHCDSKTEAMQFIHQLREAEIREEDRPDTEVSY